MPIRRSNGARHTLHSLVAIARNGWSQSIGIIGHNQSVRGYAGRASGDTCKGGRWQDATASAFPLPSRDAKETGDQASRVGQYLPYPYPAPVRQYSNAIALWWDWDGLVERRLAPRIAALI
jgi:hypothetical protein